MNIFELNKQSLVTFLQNSFNDQMEKVAEPIITKALSEIETVMREKLASMLISYIEHAYSIDFMRNEIRITVRREK